MKIRIRRFATPFALALGLTAAPAIAQTQGITAREILIGTIQDLSGPVAALGVPNRQGMDLAVDVINEQGGIHGRKVRLLAEDSSYDTKKGVLATQKLLTGDKVFAFVGNLGSALVNATLPGIVEKGVPLLFPGAPGSELVLNPPKRLVFASALPYDIAMADATTYAHDVLGKRKFCIMYQDDDSGTGVLKGVAGQLKKYNLPLVQTSYKRGDIHFSSQFAVMRKAGCDVVMLGTITRETAAAAVERAQMGWDVPMIAGQGALSDAVLKLGGEAVEGLYCAAEKAPTPLLRHKPAIIELTRRYRARYNTDNEPDSSVLNGYSNMMLFAEGARRAGPDLNVDTLVAGLEQINRFETPGFPPATFSKTQRLAYTNVHIMQIKAGAWTMVREAK